MSDTFRTESSTTPPADKAVLVSTTPPADKVALDELCARYPDATELTLACRVGRKPVKLEGIRIAGLQFLPSEGGASLLVPQAVIDTLNRVVAKQRAESPSLMQLTSAIAELRQQIYVLTGVQI